MEPNMPKDKTMSMFFPDGQEPVTGFVLGLFCAILSGLSILSILIFKRGQLPWAVRVWLSLLVHPAHCLMGVVGIWVSFMPYTDFLHSPACEAVVLAVLSSFWSVQLATLAVTTASVFYRLLCLTESSCRFPTNYVDTDPVERFCLDSCNCLLLSLATVILVYTLSILASMCTLVSVVMAKSNIFRDYLPNCADMSQKWDMASRQWVGLATFNVVVFVTLAIPFLTFCQWKEGCQHLVRDIQAPGEPEGQPVGVALVADRPLAMARSIGRNHRPVPVQLHQRSGSTRNTAEEERTVSRYFPNGGGVSAPGRRPRQKWDREEEEMEEETTDGWKSSDGEEEEMGEEEEEGEGEKATKETPRLRDNPIQAHHLTPNITENENQRVALSDEAAEKLNEGRLEELELELKLDAQADPITAVPDNPLSPRDGSSSTGRRNSRDNGKASDSPSANENEASRQQRLLLVTRGAGAGAVSGAPSRDVSPRADDARGRRREEDLLVGEPHYIPGPVFAPYRQNSLTIEHERKNKPRFPFSKVDHRSVEVPAMQTTGGRPSVFPYTTVLSLTGCTYMAVYGPLSCYLIFSPLGPTFAFNSTAFNVFCHLVLIKGVIDALVYLVASQV